MPLTIQDHCRRLAEHLETIIDMCDEGALVYTNPRVENARPRPLQCEGMRFDVEQARKALTPTAALG